ncbi:MAG: thiamine pyrophosphate-dependent dehydrogenase E1 component subunit alpha [Verrucomicrobiales bacterium]
MMLARRLEDRIASIYRGGGIAGGVYLGRGQEAVSAALGHALSKGDVFAPLIRDQAGRIAFGEDPLDFTRTYLGSASGPMRGRDGNIHRGRPKAGMPAMISHLGAMIPVVCGMLLARRMQGRPMGVGATCIGDGGTSTGAFHEGLNLAAVEKLPFVLVVTNNQFAYSTPNTRQFACADLVEKASGYGVTGHSLDGTDLATSLTVIGQAVETARAGGGPQLIVANVLRLCGHGEHDDAQYVPKAWKESPLGRDCIQRAKETALANGWLDEAALAAMDDETREVARAAVATAQQEHGPDPFTEDWRALATTLS